MLKGNLAQTRLREHLLVNGGAPGSKVPSERDLAATLAVSRPALREAMRGLVHLGLLEQRRGAGTFVAAVDLTDLMRVRRQLEPLAAQEAALHRDDADVGELDGLVRALSNDIHDADRFAQSDMHLHERLAAASKNRILAQVLGDLTDMLRLSRQRTAHDLDVRRRSLRDLSELVDHVTAQRADAAAEVMARHLDCIGAALDADDPSP